MSNLFFRANGLSWWTDAWKKAATLMLSNELASYRNTNFAGMPKGMKRLLNIYGIGEDEWTLLARQKMKELDGNFYMTPDHAQEIALADIEAVFKKRGEKFTEGAGKVWRDDLEDKVRTLIRDRVSYAVLEPDARTRSYLYGGTKTGTPWGEAARFVMQFKSFPSAFLQRTVGREFYGRDTEGVLKGLARSVLPGKGEEMNNFARMFLMMTLFGYGAMTAKNLIAGRTPRDPKDPKTWLAAALQGGGLGLYGDFLLGEKSHMGSSFWSSVGGPTGTTIEQIVNLWWDTREGNDVTADAFRLAFANIPGNNLFYVRTAFDFLIGYNLYEMMSPGYFERYRRRIKKENNQDLIFKPLKWF